jgi:hypothetical protein
LEIAVMEKTNAICTVLMMILSQIFRCISFLKILFLITLLVNALSNLASGELLKIS